MNIINLDQAYKTYYINPQNKYFEFSTNTMIGYISSFILLNNPILNSFKLGDKYYHSKALKMKINDTFDTFNSLGIKIIETDICSDIKLMEDHAKDYGYELISDEHLVATTPTSDITVETLEEDIKVDDVDISKDWRELSSFILIKENISELSINQFFEFVKDGRQISHKIIRNNGKIVAHGLLVKSRWDKKVGLMSFFHALGSNQDTLRDNIMEKILVDCKTYNIDVIEVHLRDDVHDYQNNYTKYGFIFNKIITFEKMN